MKKINKDFLKSITFSLLVFSSIGFVSCSSDEQETKNQKSQISKTSYKEDGIARVYTLGNFTGRAAAFLQSDKHLEVNPIELDNLPSDINALYINTSEVNINQLKKIKQGKLNDNFLHGNMKLILDSNTAADSLKFKAITLELGAAHTKKTCASVMRINDDGSIANIPVWDHNVVSFSQMDIPTPNSLHMIKSFIYEAWDGEASDPTAEARNIKMLSDLGFESTNNDDQSKNLFFNYGIRFKGDKRIREVKDALEYWEGEKLRPLLSDEYNNSKRITNAPFTILGPSNWKGGEIVEIFNQYQACSYSGSIASLYLNTSVTTTFSLNVNMSVGLKLVPENTGKMFGMDLKEIAPQVGAGFGASWSKTVTQGYSATIPANKCGRLALKKDVLKIKSSGNLAPVMGFQKLDKMRFNVLESNSAGNDKWYTWEYKIIGQNFDTMECATWSVPSGHPVYINNPYVHTPYYCVDTW